MSFKQDLVIKALLVLLAILAFSPSKSQDHIRLVADGERDFEKIRTFFYENWEKNGRNESAYKKFKRWEDLMLPRLIDGKIPSSQHFKNRVIEYDEIKARDRRGRSSVQNSWSNLGPYSWEVAPNGYNPGNGRVNCITVDPIDKNIIYIGAASGGLWKSVDGGNSWITTTDEVAVLGITDIYVSPNDNSHVIALTGDAYGSDSPSIGLLESMDAGLTWQEMNLSFDVASYQVFYKLEVDPTNEDNMFVAGPNSGIYRSTDGGVSWEIVTNQGVTDLIFHPEDPKVLYAPTGSEHYENEVTISKTEDGGDSWNTHVFEIETLGKRLGRKSVAVSANDPDAVYILASASNSTFGGLFKSSDKLETLELQSNSPNIFGYAKDGSDDSGQGWYDLAIAVNPENAEELYVSGVHIWKSIDSGVNWELQNFWIWSDPTYPYVHADNHTLDFYHGDLFAGGDGGIFKSDDFGNSFTNLSAGLAIGQFYRIGTHPTDEDVIVGGLQDNGSYIHYDGVWRHLFGADGMEALIDHTDPSTIFTQYQNGGIIRYSNHGNVIEHYVENTDNEFGGWITPYIMHPDDHNTLYFGFQNVWESNDGGYTLEKISDFQAGGAMRILKQHSIQPENMLVYIDNLLYLSNNSGGEWIDITNGLPALLITDAEFANDDPNEIWVTFGTYDSSDKVYQSVDGGISWTNRSEGLPRVPVNCVLSQKSCDKKLYAGTDIGVFTKSVDQEMWQPYGTGLPNVMIREMEIQYSTSQMYVGTYGRGVWKVAVDMDITEQNLTFDPIENKYYGEEDFELVAFVDSGLNIEFVSSDTEIITIDGNIASIVGIGEVTITARQIGSCVYQAVSESQRIEVNKAQQTITFEPLQDRYVREESFELYAESSSGLPVSFDTSDPAVIFIFNNKATIRGEGIVTITATQNGNDVYSEAEPVSQTQAIIVLTIEDVKTGIRLFPNPVNNSTLNVHIPSPQDKTQIHIFDLNGKTVFSKRISRSRKDLQLDISKLDKGMYGISINDVKLQFVKN